MNWLKEERRASRDDTAPHRAGCQCPECARDEAYAAGEDER